MRGCCWLPLLQNPPPPNVIPFYIPIIAAALVALETLSLPVSGCKHRGSLSSESRFVRIPSNRFDDWRRPYIATQNAAIRGSASVYTVHYRLINTTTSTSSGSGGSGGNGTADVVAGGRQAISLSWDRTQQQRMNPGIFRGWLFNTQLDSTPYQGGGNNAVDAGFLQANGEKVCAILERVYDLPAWRAATNQPAGASFLDVWPSFTGACGRVLIKASTHRWI